MEGFFNKSSFVVGKLRLFGLFSGDKGDNIDMWMIKITIKANQIETDVLLISKVDNVQKPCLSLSAAFSIILSVCEFYQKFILTHLPLESICLWVTSRLTRCLLAKCKIQRNNYHHGNGGPSLTGKTSSVPLIFTECQISLSQK